MLGIAWADIDAKYRTLMPNSGLTPARIEASLAMIRGISGAERIAPLVAAITPLPGGA